MGEVGATSAHSRVKKRINTDSSSLVCLAATSHLVYCILTLLSLSLRHLLLVSTMRSIGGVKNQAIDLNPHRVHSFPDPSMHEGEFLASISDHFTQTDPATT
jgi:hypothetical protein